MPWIVPIPGTTKRVHPDENLRATTVELLPDDVREIEDGFARLGV